MIISRKYEVLSPLGQGGMGVVYKVRHVVLDTLLALKVLPPEFMANPEMVSRFYREARVMARLRHPNIVRVLDIDHDEGHEFHYFVMEYIQGPTLRTYLQEKGSLPLPEVLNIALQVARALVYAHAHTPPVIHRDIKPANIMIEEESSRVVVMDFGIAKELGGGDMTKSGVVLGTLKYCPPEQLRNEPLDGSADVYALGMVMYEAYTGGHLFAGVDEAGVIGKVLYEASENEPHFLHPTPPLFVALMKKAIAKSRERRYRHMEELLHDIEMCFASLKENGALPLLVSEKDSAFEVQAIDVLDEQIRTLEAQRRRQLVAAVRTQTLDARAKAVTAGAERLATVLLRQGEEQETLGYNLLQEGNEPAALEAYRTALDFFIKAYEETEVTAALQTAEQARQEMQAAKIAAERVGAREKARTFYRRALALQAQADEQWEAQAYRESGASYDEARSLFTDAQELAVLEGLKMEAATARTNALAAKERAIKEEAEEFAHAAFLEAFAHEQQAGSAMQQQEFVQARDAYLLAQDAYERAVQEITMFGRPFPVAVDSSTSGDAETVTETRKMENVPGTGAEISAPPTPGDLVSSQLDVDQRNARQRGEDHWEIGERVDTPERSPSSQPPPPSSSRTLLFIAGAVMTLALVGWFGWSLIQQPSAPSPVAPVLPQPPLQSQPPQLTLQLSQSEPREETLNITEGEAVAFAVRASGAEPFKYEWTLEGSPVSHEREWTYHSPRGEGAYGAKTVRVRVADQYGQSVGRSWQVTVTAANKPPRMIAATPSKAEIELMSGEGQAFRLEVEDPEREKLEYEWTVDGKKSGAQSLFTWKASEEGKYRIKAVAKDQKGLSVSQEWRVAVVAPPATPPPLPTPTNTAPRIAQQFPVERTVSVREGETVPFSALALDPDGEEVVYSWSVDGKRAEQGDRFAYVADDAGQHLIDLEVTDKGGLKDSFRWEIQVAALPAAPRVTMYTPHTERMQLYAHLSRFFGVEVETPGVTESPLRYAWKIDGRSAPGRELLEFKDQPPGRHEVEVTVTGPSGASVSHRWIVEVQERQGLGDQGFAGPPYLEMFELGNEVSADKKQVIVRGKLRNVSDRKAENVIVWISALDAEKATVSRRLALPAPQPLSPDQVATFSLPFTNQSEISDFRVEIVSK